MRTWLNPYGKVWYRAYPDAAVPYRQLAHFLKPLAKAHPEERIVAELTAYLRKTHPRFLNLAKFAATFGSWSRPEPQARRPYTQSADDADRKAGIPIP